MIMRKTAILDWRRELQNELGIKVCDKTNASKSRAGKVVQKIKTTCQKCRPGKIRAKKSRDK